MTRRHSLDAPELRLRSSDAPELALLDRIMAAVSAHRPQLGGRVYVSPLTAARLMARVSVRDDVVSPNLPPGAFGVSVMGLDWFQDATVGPDDFRLEWPTVPTKNVRLSRATRPSCTILWSGIVRVVSRDDLWIDLVDREGRVVHSEPRGVGERTLIIELDDEGAWP